MRPCISSLPDFLSDLVTTRVTDATTLTSPDGVRKAIVHAGHDGDNLVNLYETHIVRTVVVANHAILVRELAEWLGVGNLGDD